MGSCLRFNLRPKPRADFLKAQLIHPLHDPVGLTQRGRRMGRRYSYNLHASGARRFNPHVRVLEHHAADRPDSKSLRGEQEDFRVGLAVRDILPGDGHAEKNRGA